MVAERFFLYYKLNPTMPSRGQGKVRCATVGCSGIGDIIIITFTERSVN